MIRKEILDNGLTLLTETMPSVRSVSLGVWLRTGSRHETPSANGVSHFIEHLVFKGTRKKSAQEIALIIDSVGGQVDAFTSKEYTCFYARVLDEHVPVAIDLLSDIVLSPRFAADDIEKERKVIYEEMKMVDDTPDELIYDLFSKHYWKGHALGRPIQGTKRTVASLTPRRLMSYFRHSYKPGNMIIAAAGNLRHAAVARGVARAFESLPKGTVERRYRPPRAYPVVVRKTKKELEQLHVFMGMPAFPTSHPGRFALLVLNTVLGGTMSSRLWQRIREQSGLAYSVYSGVNSFYDCGYQVVYAATSPASGDRVVRQVMDELSRIKREPVTDEELRVAKEHLKGSLMLSLESSSSRMSNLARQEIYFGRQFGNGEVLRAIDAVDAGDVRRVAQEVLTGERCALAVLGRVDRFTTRRSDLAF